MRRGTRRLGQRMRRPARGGSASFAEAETQAESVLRKELRVRLLVVLEGVYLVEVAPLEVLEPL